MMMDTPLSIATREFLDICLHEDYTLPGLKIKVRCMVTSPTTTDIAEKFNKKKIKKADLTQAINEHCKTLEKYAVRAGNAI